MKKREGFKIAQRGKITNVILCMTLAASIGFFVVCSTDEDTLYTCTYEVRYSACDGSPWYDWQEECYQFDLDDYIEGWTAEDVCNKFTESDIDGILQQSRLPLSILDFYTPSNV